MKEHRSYYDVPNMIARSVQNYLYEIGRGWTGQGTAIELGSWCGGSAVPLLTGLVEAGYDRSFYAYDRWKTNAEEVGKLKKWGIDSYVHQDILPWFRANVERVYDNVKTYKDRIERTVGGYDGGPIEICIFDAPKKDPTFTIAVEALKKYWIPGVTVLALLDFNFYRKFDGEAREALKAPVRFMNENAECFEVMKDFWPNTSCVFFKYVNKLP